MGFWNHWDWWTWTDGSTLLWIGIIFKLAYCLRFGSLLKLDIINQIFGNGVLVLLGFLSCPEDKKNHIGTTAHRCDLRRRWGTRWLQSQLPQTRRRRRGRSGLTSNKISRALATKKIILEILEDTFRAWLSSLKFSDTNPSTFIGAKTKMTSNLLISLTFGFPQLCRFDESRKHEICSDVPWPDTQHCVSKPPGEIWTCYCWVSTMCHKIYICPST